MNFLEERKRNILESYKQPDVFEKGGKRAQIGEVRIWGGVKYVKHQEGWVTFNQKTGKGSVYGSDGKKKMDANHSHIGHFVEHTDTKGGGHTVLPDGSMNINKPKSEDKDKDLDKLYSKLTKLQDTEEFRDYLEDNDYDEDEVDPEDWERDAEDYPIAKKLYDIHTKIVNLTEEDSKKELSNSPEIGKTKSGKQVYQDGSELEQDEDWTAEDHEDAASLHHSEIDKTAYLYGESQKNIFSANTDKAKELANNNKSHREHHSKHLEKMTEKLKRDEVDKVSMDTTLLGVEGSGATFTSNKESNYTLSGLKAGGWDIDEDTLKELNEKGTITLVTYNRVGTPRKLTLSLPTKDKKTS